MAQPIFSLIIALYFSSRTCLDVAPARGRRHWIFIRRERMEDGVASVVGGVEEKQDLKTDTYAYLQVIHIAILVR